MFQIVLSPPKGSLYPQMKLSFPVLMVRVSLVDVDPADGADRVLTTPDRFRAAGSSDIHVNTIRNTKKNVAQINVFLVKDERYDFLERFIMC